MPREDLSVRQLAAEDVKSAAYSSVDATLPQLFYPLQVFQGAHATRVGHGDWRSCEDSHQSFFDASLQAFHINAMNKKLVAMGCQFRKRLP